MRVPYTIVFGRVHTPLHSLCYQDTRGVKKNRVYLICEILIE
jgi:hypothetical protein